MSKKSVWLTVGTVLLLAMMMVIPALADAVVTLNPAHVGVQNSDFDQGDCPTPPEGQDGWYGWHFIATGNANFTSLSVTFQDAGPISADPFPGTAFVVYPDNSHAYVWTETDDILLAGSGTTDGTQTSFNLSHTCTPEDVDVEHLTVSKTVVTSYDRTHNWDIAKSVTTDNELTHDGAPKIWLYTDGSGKEYAYWTIDLTYLGYQDFNHNVSGTITIKNDGDLPAVITDIEDLLAGNEIAFACNGDYDLAVGEILECTYGEAGFVEGENVVTVTTESGGEYGTTEPIVWGDPVNVDDATVNVTDDSDIDALDGIYGPFNAADFAEGETKTIAEYEKFFSWADYGADNCGDFVYNNTATIDETGQEATATLKVNVQCYIYETAYGKGGNATCFIPTFNNWGWTNPLGAEDQITLDMWAGAGQCDTTKGTYVGTVTITASGGNVTFAYDILPGFLLDETHSYAGSTMYPQVKQGKKVVSTVAPGSYYIQSPFTGGWAIAHAVVGIPDPNFGP